MLNVKHKEFKTSDVQANIKQHDQADTQGGYAKGNNNNNKNNNK